MVLAVSAFLFNYNVVVPLLARMFPQASWSIVATTEPVELVWGAKDTFIVPPWRWHQHCNTSRTEAAILFSESDLPVFEALDLYREESNA